MRKPMNAAEIKAKADRAGGIARAVAPLAAAASTQKQADGRDLWDMTPAEEEEFWKDFDFQMEESFRRMDAEQPRQRAAFLALPVASNC
jgi:hypothetical protein